MDLQLKGLRALVTGASRGLGYATALCLAQEGCRVAINSRSRTKIAAAAEQIGRETGQPVTGIAGDLAMPSVPARVVKQAAAELGGLDLLVTNAGGPPAGAFQTLDEADWQKAIDLSLLAHVRLILAALPWLKRSPAASVLTVTSYSVKQPIPNLILSNSVRMATIGLTKSLSQELGPLGIRVNSILPGWTETERVKELMTFRARQKGTSMEEEIALQSAQSPLGRMGKPEEFARSAVFLLSPAASYLTGVMLNVEGGMYKGMF